MVKTRHEYIREDGRVESEGVLTVKWINQDGCREILGVAAAPREEEATWSKVFANLLDRKLDHLSIRYVVSDERRGLKVALRRYFPGATWQCYQQEVRRCPAGGVVVGDYDPVDTFPARCC